MDSAPTILEGMDRALTGTKVLSYVGSVYVGSVAAKAATEVVVMCRQDDCF